MPTDSQCSVNSNKQKQNIIQQDKHALRHIIVKFLKKKKDKKKTQNLNEAQQETLHQRRCRWLLNKNYGSQKTINIQRVGRKSANLEFVSGKCAL